MHILHFHPTQKAGALEAQIAEMVGHQKSQGHDIHVVTFPKSPFENVCAHKGFSFLSFNVERTVEHFKFWSALEKVIADKKFDVVHVHSSEDVPRFQQLKHLQKLCGMQQPKIILQVHVQLQNARKDAWHWIQNSEVSEVWCADASAKSFLKEATGLPNEKFQIFNYGKTLPVDFFFAKDKARQVLNVNSTSLVIGSTGKVEKSSGLEEALKTCTDLMAKHSQLEFVHLGAPPENDSESKQFQEFLEEWVSFLKADVRNRIHLIKDKKEWPRCLKAFDLYIFNRKEEGFPFDLLTAQLAGVPALATKFGRTGEFIINEESGILFSEENSLLETLEKAINVQNKWVEWGARGFEKARQEFDQKIIFDKMLDRYKSLKG